MILGKQFFIVTKIGIEGWAELKDAGMYLIEWIEKPGINLMERSRTFPTQDVIDNLENGTWSLRGYRGYSAEMKAHVSSLGYSWLDRRNFTFTQSGEGSIGIVIDGKGLVECADLDDVVEHLWFFDYISKEEKTAMTFEKGKDFVFIRVSSAQIGKATFNEETGGYHFETRGAEFVGFTPLRSHNDLDIDQVENEFKMGFIEVVGIEQWDFVNVIDELSMKIGIPTKEYLLGKRLEREKVASISELSALQVKNATFHFKRKLKALEETLKK